MPKPEEITEELKKIVQSCQTVLEWAKGENISYQMIRDDLTFIRGKLEVARNEEKEIKAHNDTIRKQADGIVDAAKKEAEGILAMARDKMVEAAQDRELAKKELASAKSEAYLAKKAKDKVLAA